METGPLVVMGPLSRRLRRLAGGWDPALRAELNRYVRSRRIQMLSGRGDEPPHVVLLPVWLLRCYRPRQSPADARFLHDVLWGQFCVYLAFRIRDDLLDHVSGTGPLVLASDLLQIESVRTFLKHFPRRSRFWRLYFAALESTIQGELLVDRLQMTRSAGVAALLHGYAEVCAIFTIGAIAVCLRYSGARDIGRARRFWHEIAIAGQLVDDFADLDEDWRRGRFNAIARIMIGKRLSLEAPDGSGLAAVKQRLAEGGADSIARMVLGRINRAERALGPMRGKAPYPGLGRHRENVERMRRSMHAVLVRSFFSSLHAGGRRSQGRVPFSRRRRARHASRME